MIKAIKRLKQRILGKKNAYPTDDQVKEASAEISSKMEDIMKSEIGRAHV